MKMYVTFEYQDKVRIMELSEFKEMPFYVPKKFAKVRIYDFVYLSSQRQVREYRKMILDMPIRKLRKLNL